MPFSIADNLVRTVVSCVVRLAIWLPAAGAWALRWR
ncbi:hypothetical protein LTSEURB_3313, partial [Salmonella enterica subsp. enterica serovar Urbana str. R8-2977]